MVFLLTLSVLKAKAQRPVAPERSEETKLWGAAIVCDQWLALSPPPPPPKVLFAQSIPAPLVKTDNISAATTIFKLSFRFQDLPFWVREDLNEHLNYWQN